MKYFGTAAVITALTCPSAIVAQSTHGLPLSASNCAIAEALNVALPANCTAADLGAKRGIVIRLDKELEPKEPLPQTQDVIVSSAPASTSTVNDMPKDHAAA